MRVFVRGFVVILILGLLAGAIYERVGKQRDQEQLPRVGQAVDIGGRSLNIYCSGSGSPSVILDTGGSAPGYSNMPLQRLIAKETRACWFDRAGLGWSDPSPVTQTSAAIAADLHELLRAVKMDPPYILVGSRLAASMFGCSLRRIQAKLPGWCYLTRFRKISSNTSRGRLWLPSTGCQQSSGVAFAGQHPLRQR
jgi:hypothetical protein